jgi:hypothetical protein
MSAGNARFEADRRPACRAGRLVGARDERQSNGSLFRSRAHFLGAACRSAAGSFVVHGQQGDAMRFMMIVKPPVAAYTNPPAQHEFAAMGRYNDELRRAGVLLDLNGLAATEAGAKVKFNGDKRTVIDGPFTDAKEVIGGYWIIQAHSKVEALEWAKRIPFSTEVHPGEEVEVEIRQIHELDELHH